MFSSARRPPGRILAILGGAGDLSVRHLVPGLAHLERRQGGPLFDGVVCVDRAATTLDELRARVAAELRRPGAGLPAEVCDSVLARLDLARLDLDALDLDALDRDDLDRDDLDRDDLDRDGAGEQGPVADARTTLARHPAVIYCALPAAALRAALAWLARQDLVAGSVVAVEKPFGRDRRSARRLSEACQRLLPSATVHRVDHVLHHAFARDLVRRRLELPDEWDRHTVERVELRWEEAAAVAPSRAGFFDGTGALDDLVQSHLLQLLALVAMAPPAMVAGLAAAKADVLGRAQLATSPEPRRGRYVSGVIDGAAVPAYAELPEVHPARGTETFASLRVEIDDPRWRGVPFDLSAGKALARSRKEVVVHRRGGLSPQRFGFDGTPRGDDWLPPSALVLQDLLSDDARGGVSESEVDHGWRIVEQVRARWAETAAPLLDYVAGSAEPEPG